MRTPFLTRIQIALSVALTMGFGCAKSPVNQTTYEGVAGDSFEAQTRSPISANPHTEKSVRKMIVFSSGDIDQDARKFSEVLSDIPDKLVNERAAEGLHVFICNGNTDDLFKLGAVHTVDSNEYANLQAAARKLSHGLFQIEQRYNAQITKIFNSAANRLPREQVIFQNEIAAFKNRLAESARELAPSVPGDIVWRDAYPELTPDAKRFADAIRPAIQLATEKRHLQRRLLLSCAPSKLAVIDTRTGESSLYGGQRITTLEALFDALGATANERPQVMKWLKQDNPEYTFQNGLQPEGSSPFIVVRKIAFAKEGFVPQTTYRLIQAWNRGEEVGIYLEYFNALVFTRRSLYTRTSDDVDSVPRHEFGHSAFKFSPEKMIRFEDNEFHAIVRFPKDRMSEVVGTYGCKNLDELKAQQVANLDGVRRADPVLYQEMRNAWNGRK